MSEMSGLFTLTNYGNENRNCTLTTLLFPANFQIEDFKVGPPAQGVKGKKVSKRCRGLRFESCDRSLMT